MISLHFFLTLENMWGSWGGARGSGISISGLYNFPGSIPGGKSPNPESSPNTENWIQNSFDDACTIIKSHHIFSVFAHIRIQIIDEIKRYIFYKGKLRSFIFFLFGLSIRISKLQNSKRRKKKFRVIGRRNALYSPIEIKFDNWAVKDNLLNSFSRAWYTKNLRSIDKLEMLKFHGRKLILCFITCLSRRK